MQITAAISRENEPAPRLEVVELAEPQAGEVRVRIVATGICHSDLMFHGPFGSAFAPKPIVLGHEGAGVVEAAGAGAVPRRQGDQAGAADVRLDLGHLTDASVRQHQS